MATEPLGLRRLRFCDLGRRKIGSNSQDYCDPELNVLLTGCGNRPKTACLRARLGISPACLLRPLTAPSRSRFGACFWLSEHCCLDFTGMRGAYGDGIAGSHWIQGQWGPS